MNSDFTNYLHFFPDFIALYIIGYAECYQISPNGQMHFRLLLRKMDHFFSSNNDSFLANIQVTNVVERKSVP